MVPPQENPWRDALFCLLSPDCVRRHLTAAVLRRFEKIGLIPTGWRYLRVTGRQLDAVAEIQGAGAGQTFRYRALDALFALGPALALRLEDAAPTSARRADDRYAAAARLKGASSPHDAAAGTIRRDLGAINTVLSLLHVSDSPANAELESRTILDTGDEVAPFSPAADLPGVIGVLESTHPPERRGYDDVLAAVRARLVAALWADLTAEGHRLVETLSSSGELADPKAGRRIADTLVPTSARHPLAGVLRLPFDPSGPRVDMTEVRQLMRLYGCGPDDWEYAVLCTSSYFEPVRAVNGRSNGGAA